MGFDSPLPQGEGSGVRATGLKFWGKQSYRKLE